MTIEFRFPDIKNHPASFGGIFKQPLRLGSLPLSSMRFPELEKVLTRWEFVEGFSEGVYPSSTGFISRRYEQGAMMLHGDDQVRLLSAPLEATGRAYRTILVRREIFPAAWKAGLNYLRGMGLAEKVDSALEDCASPYPEVVVSAAIAYRLAPLFDDHWELALGYQKAVISAAGAHFVDWSKTAENPCRKVLLMSRYLPHMREVKDRSSFEDSSKLCAIELTL